MFKINEELAPKFYIKLEPVNGLCYNLEHIISFTMIL